MFENINHPYPFNNNFKHNLKTIGLVGMGFMLFVLYFQPFGINFLQSERDSYFVLGAGFMSTGTLFANTLLLPGLMPEVFNPSRWTIKKEMIWNFWLFCNLFLILSLMAWLVNRVQLTELPIFRTGGLALLPLVLFNLINYNHSLKDKMVTVLDNSRKHWFHEDKPDAATIAPTIEVVKDFKIMAENGKDFFAARLDDILVFHSSGNYIEIYWLENQVKRRTLFRKTFAIIEQYMKENEQFQKCHRCWMVNLKMINSITGNSKGYFIELDKLGFNIPVSRNYIASIKALIPNQVK
jgi:hypothetical protein